MQQKQTVTDFTSLPPGKRGTCEGLALHEFFLQPTPNKRLVDINMLRPMSQRVMSKNATSLVLVGSKPHQHVMDYFYGLGVKHMTIVEGDKVQVDKITEYLKTSKKAKRISLVHADASKVFYGGYTHIELDLMKTHKNNSFIVKRALEEQARDPEKRMKSFIFTQGFRGAGGHQEVFKYINSVVGIIGVSLKGFNGEEGSCRNGVRHVEKQGKFVYCNENIPDFNFMGNRLREFKCFSYRDKHHGAMVTTLLIYR